MVLNIQTLNENSIVMRLDFGQNRILFMGDAEAGGRADPDTPPVGHSIEGILLTVVSLSCERVFLSSDIMVAKRHHVQRFSILLEPSSS